MLYRRCRTLGKKSGRGFYDWKDGKAQKGAASNTGPAEYITDRLILPILDACVECLREGIARDGDQVDGAMIFGTGFAPFRGGPMHYARSRGITEVVAGLNEMAERHGDRFRLDPGWKDIG